MSRLTACYSHQPCWRAGHFYVWAKWQHRQHVYFVITPNTVFRGIWILCTHASRFVSPYEQKRVTPSSLLRLRVSVPGFQLSSSSFVSSLSLSHATGTMSTEQQNPSMVKQPLASHTEECLQESTHMHREQVIIFEVALTACTRRLPLCRSNVPIWHSLHLKASSQAAVCQVSHEASNFGWLDFFSRHKFSQANLADESIDFLSKT